jgi:hypothetical protein
MPGKKISKDTRNLDESIDSLLAELELPSDHEVRKHTGNVKQAEKIRGRKRDDQSARMSGAGNSMAGKEHPNKGKSLPQIGRPGVAKPEGFGEKISKARKGVPNLKALGVERPDHSEAMKDPTRNKGAQTMRQTMTCPHCGKTANVPNYKRWHGDNCKMKG